MVGPRLENWVAEDCWLRDCAVVVEHLGGSSLLYVQVDGLDQLLTVEQRGKTDFVKGQEINLLFDPAQSYLFDSDGRRIQSSR